jgi:replicative DNA helicase
LVASEVIEDLNSDELPVTLSGFDNYDLSEGHLEIIAGRPAQGKSSFAMNIAENVCRSGKKVLVFSLEMTRKELAKRMLSSMSDIPFAAIKNKDIKQYQQETFQATINEFSNMEIFIDDSTGLSIEEVAAKAMKMKMKHGIDLVVVDYLQLLKTQRPTENRALEITKIAYGLKNISKDIKVPVIALSQLNRSVESRGGDKIPQLSDLKESGGIEEAADRVGFMYRPEYYGIMEDADGISTEGLAFVVVAKNRHGETGSLSLNFEGKYMRFTDRKTINTDEAF